MPTLSEYLRTSAITQREFADRVRVSPSFLSEILKGGKSPSLAVALRIQKATKGQVDIQTLLASPGVGAKRHGDATAAVQDGGAE